MVVSIKIRKCHAFYRNKIGQNSSLRILRTSDSKVSPPVGFVEIYMLRAGTRVEPDNSDSQSGSDQLGATRVDLDHEKNKIKGN